jgi:integrase
MPSKGCEFPDCPELQLTCKEKQTCHQLKRFVIIGKDRNAKQVRRSFSSREAAEDTKAQLDLNHWNQGAGMRPVVTDLTDELLPESRFAFSRLNGHRLSDAVDFFLKHHPADSVNINLSAAVTAYLSDCEGRIRQRTLTQKKSALDQFAEAVGRVSVRNISTELVAKHLSRLRSRDGVNPAAPKTYNNTRVDLLTFFAWCQSKPRQWVSFNPVSDIPARLIEIGEIKTLNLDACEKLMRHVEQYHGGKLVPFFALALFAGIRPAGELTKLNANLIDVENGLIRIPPSVSKVKRARQIKIRTNLAQWLKRFPGPILPVNHDRDIRKIRKTFKLSHDVLRHTFISALVMSEGSFAEAAIESGNSERIIRDHYFGAMTKSEAKEFWSIQPKI